MRSFEEVILGRRSVRSFLAEKPVPTPVITRALELSQRSPSNCNAQPWSIFIVGGERCVRLKEQLLTAAEAPGEPGTPNFQGLHRQRQVSCAVELYTQLGIERGDLDGRREAFRRNFEFFGAPQVALLCMPSELGVQVALDAGCWLQSFLLSLESLGVQSCAQAALRCYPDVISNELGIRSDLEILCGIAFGYEQLGAAVNLVRQPRAPLSENVTWLGFED